MDLQPFKFEICLFINYCATYLKFFGILFGYIEATTSKQKFVRDRNENNTFFYTFDFRYPHIHGFQEPPFKLWT